MKTIKCFLPVLLIINLLPLGTLFPQYNKYSVQGGLSTIYFLGDTPSKWPLLPNDERTIIGGGFNNMQAGIGFTINLPVDSGGSFIIPLGFDNYWFQSGIVVAVSDTTEVRWLHNADLLNFSLGMNYFLFKFPIANVRLFTGAELRFSIIQRGILIRETENIRTNTSTFNNINTKEQAFRLGGAIRLGIEGELYRPWYLSTSLGYGVLNLIGINDERGDLFSPDKNFDIDNEKFLHCLYFNFLIQYKL